MNVISAYLLLCLSIRSHISFDLNHPKTISTHIFTPNYYQETVSNYNFRTQTLFNFFYNSFFNYDYNYGNYCNYIAMEMVMCFYDTYFNDGIIPEGYDVPGYIDSIVSFSQDFEIINTDNYGSPGVGASYNYSNLEQQRLNEYNSNCLLELLTNSNNCQNPVGLSSFENAYSNVVNRLNVNDCFELVYVTTEEDFYQFYEEGIPLVIWVQEGLSYHTVLVCEFDGESILYNNGYSERKNDENPSYGVCTLNDVYYIYAITPTSSLTHLCSDNYRQVNNNVETSICPCMLQGYDYFSNHNHQITTSNGTYHLETCPSTNESRYVPHTFSTPYNIDPVGHDRSCIYCQEEEHENHLIEDYINATSSGHTTVFDDGCQLNQGHRISNIECYGNAVHKLTCPCSAYSLGYHYPCLYVVDGVVYNDYFDDFEIVDVSFPELEEQDDGWVCLCGYSNTMIVSADTQYAIVDYFLGLLEE